MNADISVLVCSFLEKEQVARIAAHPGVEVSYRPDLLPQPRYPCDHHGPAPALTPCVFIVTWIDACAGQ